jgi:hypothetical protein
MTTALAVAGLAALFVLFGVLQPGADGGCGNCSCEGDGCRLEEDRAASPGAEGR